MTDLIEIHGVRSDVSIVVIVVTWEVFWDKPVTPATSQSPKMGNIEQIFHSKLRVHKVSIIILQNHQTEIHLFYKLNYFSDLDNLSK